MTFPKNIIFDFGGVLLDIDVQLSIDAFARLGISTLDPTHIHPNNQGVFLDMEVGKAHKREFLEAMCGMCGAALKPSDQQILDAWNAMLLPYRWENFELLDRLRAKGHNVYLLSNTNSVHHNYFESKFDCEHPVGRTFRSFFNEVFYSDELEMRKPHVEIYQKVETLIEPGEILFVDDNAPNLVAPASIGWKTYHMARSTNVRKLLGEYCK